MSAGMHHPYAHVFGGEQGRALGCERFLWVLLYTGHFKASPRCLLTHGGVCGERRNGCCYTS